jgi:WD40 repeat protein/Tfp pilus assembly protein PilF
MDAGEFAKVEYPRQPNNITGLAFNHAGDLIATAALDQSLRLWDMSGRLLLSAPGFDGIEQVHFSADDRHLVFAGAHGRCEALDVSLGEGCRTLFEPDAENLSAVTIHPGGRLLASAHMNGITFWDAATGSKLGRMIIGNTTALSFHPVTGDLVDAEFRGTYSFGVERSAPGESPEIFTVKPRPDFYLGPGAMALDLAAHADMLAVAYDDRVRLNRNTNSAYAIVGEFIGEPGFKSVALSPNGEQIAAANWKTGELWLWNRQGPSQPERRLSLGGPAHLSYSPDGRWLACGTIKTVTLWETTSWQAKVQLPRPTMASQPALVEFAGSGGALALTWTDQAVRLINTNGSALANFETPHAETLVALALSADGSQLAGGTAARSVLLWDLNYLGRRLHELGLRTELPSGAAPTQVSSSVQLRIGPLDRLRFSQPKQILRLRRDIAELTGFIRDHPNTYFYYQHRAEKYLEVGDYEKAIADYRKWIELDEKDTTRDSGMKAWPLRDLAFVYLTGPDQVKNYAQAAALTQRAIELEPTNPDNHFRYGMACYRLGRYDEAAIHLDTARRSWETKGSNVAAALFYEAMCSAHAKQTSVASRLLDQAKQAYATTNLQFRESQGELSELQWEAEQVVAQIGLGG